MTAAPPLTRELLGGLVERAGRTDFEAFEAQLRSSEPDGVLRKACGNRREAVCAPCAERYRQDAYHLIAAGLRGGKGVPDSVAGHPAVFFTLTAPTFGPVHAQLLGSDGRPLRCQPRRDAPTCPHGVRLSCAAVHADGDPCLGEPLCPECFDYQGAVMWNNTVGELWRYTTIYVPRAMARLAKMTQKRLKLQVRPAYVKVAEYQRRGLVHVHVLARLDRAMCKYRRHEIHPPPKQFDAELLEEAVRAAVADVSARVPDELGGGRVRWGSQLDVRQLRTGEERGEIAGFLAKYATKSTEQAGGLLHRVDPDDVDDAPVREHVRQYMRTAFELNATAVRQRQQTRPPAPQSAPDVETHWNPAALAIRARRAMGNAEPVRVRLHDNTAQIGRIARLSEGGPERDGTTLTVELDVGETVHLADVASIGPANRRARRRDRRDSRLADCAHAFGYRGHCLTKSRSYSTTFKALREARAAWVHEQILARSRDATQRALASAAERIVTLECDGVGHVTAADRHYALAEFARARERRRIGREERLMDLAGAR